MTTMEEKYLAHETGAFLHTDATCAKKRKKRKSEEMSLHKVRRSILRN